MLIWRTASTIAVPVISHEAVPAGADKPVYAPYVQRYPPDTAVALRRLQNRQPGRWRDCRYDRGADRPDPQRSHIGS